MDTVRLPEIVAALKESCCKAEWWKFVQEDVRESLLYIMDNISAVGIVFRQSFVSQFQFEHACRVVAKANKPFAEPTGLFGPKFPEEFYLSGIVPTKNLLKLDDWTEPNEADVYACVTFCQQIDVLHYMGILPDDTPKSAKFIAELLSSATSDTAQTAPKS